MKHHLYVWIVAMVLAAVAAIVYAARNSTARDNSSGADVLVAHAITLLETDIHALQHSTQAAIREAAVVVERGEIATAQAAYVLGLQYKREQNYKGEESQFKRAITLDPAWSWPYAELGNLLGRRSFRRKDEAMDVLLKASALDPTWWRPHSIMAVIHRAEGRLDEACAEAEAAIALEPIELATLNNYANILMDLGRTDEAVANLRKAIENFPDHPKPYYNMACVYAAIEEHDQAIDMLREAFIRADSLRQEALYDTDLDPLRDNPAFEELLNRQARHP